MVPTMHNLAVQIETNDEVAVQRFRKVHQTALLINLGQLVLLVWGTLQLSRAMQ